MAPAIKFVVAYVSHLIDQLDLDTQLIITTASNQEATWLYWRNVDDALVGSQSTSFLWYHRALGTSSAHHDEHMRVRGTSI